MGFLLAGTYTPIHPGQTPSLLPPIPKPNFRPTIISPHPLPALPLPKPTPLTLHPITTSSPPSPNASTTNPTTPPSSPSHGPNIRKVLLSEKRYGLWEDCAVVRGDEDRLEDEMRSVGKLRAKVENRVITRNHWRWPEIASYNAVAHRRLSCIEKRTTERTPGYNYNEIMRASISCPCYLQAKQKGL